MEDTYRMIALKAIHQPLPVAHNKVMCSLPRVYKDEDVIERLSGAGPMTFREFYRHYGPSPRTRKQNQDLGDCFKRLLDNGHIEYKARPGRGRPAVEWSVTDSGKEIVATRSQSE